MKKLLLAILITFFPSFAWAQCNGVFPALTACGSVSGGVPGQVPFSSIVGSTKTITLPNDGTTGTIANDLAAITTSGNAIRQSSSATDGSIGIVSSGAGTTGSATITVLGTVSCIFDGATTAADFVVASSTAGQCHDAGNSRPSGNQTIGQVLSTNGGAGTYSLNVIPNGAAGSGGGAGTFFVNDFCATVTTGCGTFTPGSTSSLALSASPTGSAAVAVYFDGVNQSGNTWVLSGNTITFNAAIPLSVQVVEVKWSSTSSGGTVTQVNTGTGLTGGPIIGVGTASIANTAVTAGSYTSANITVNAQGQLTAAANGSGAAGTVAYVPVGGDNTSALTTAIASAASSGLTLLLPCNTTITVNSVVVIPSHTHIQGCGYQSSIILKGANSTVTSIFSTSFVNCSTFYTDFSFRNFTIDAQGSTQAGNFYPIAMQLVSNVLFDGMAIRHPYSTLIFLAESDICGSGPGGKALQPNGQQFNSSITVNNSILDGTNQVVYSDLYDILKAAQVTITNNTIGPSRGDCGAFEFDTNFLIANNVLSQCPQGIYMETCYNGTIRDNDWAGFIVPFSGNNFTGVWAADANQTYPAGGYQGSHNLTITGNHFHDFQPTSGGENIFGVWLTGPPASLQSNAVIISDNTCYNLNAAGSATGTAYCVGLSGTIVNAVMVNNAAQFTTNTVLTSGPYTAPGYSSSNSVTGTTISGNVP